VRFATISGKSGKEKQPFLFFCRSEEDAKTIQSRMPVELDEDFVASREFYDRLKSLDKTQAPWLSVTNVLVAVNVLVFLVMAGFLGAGWIEVTDMTPYMMYGSSNAAATTDGQWWRLLTAMFIHFGVMHLVFNMWALLKVGHLVERLFGKFLFAFIYLGAGLAGGLLSLCWNGDKLWSAGASGAIFGIYGALLGYMAQEKHTLPKAVLQPLMKSTLIFAGYNLLYGLVHPGIDNCAHIGGLICGIVLGWICALPVDSDSRKKHSGERFLAAVFVLIVICGAGAVKAPRYPYVVRDEMAWSRAVKDFVAQEPDIVAKQNDQLREWQDKGDNADTFLPFISGTLAPFYADFSKTISAMVLVPDRSTDVRRNKLVRFLASKAEACKHLELSVRNKDYKEYLAYTEYENQSAAIFGRSKAKPE
jgi:rhomboid protease GluP